MKIRIGFVSNSSSCSFLINNHTSQPLSLREFVEEVIYLVDDFNREYDWNHVTHEDVLAAVACYEAEGPLVPGQNIRDFGDEDGNELGKVFDYMLRDSGHSKRFGWCLYRMNR